MPISITEVLKHSPKDVGI